jgi:hypothetical protein
VFAPTLLDNQLISRYCSFLICPGSKLANDCGDWYVPTLREVDSARGVWLLELQDRAGGSYAYGVGYMDDDQFRASRNQGRAHFAILADAPSFYLPRRLSANHGGRGQNICYEDGHITFLTDLRAVRGDDPLRNHLGFAEAGTDPNDAVVLPSKLQPTVDSRVPGSWAPTIGHRGSGRPAPSVAFPPQRAD